MKVHTVEEVASVLRVDPKTVLRMIKRGILLCLPGIRHKRIPDTELQRYLDVRSLRTDSATKSSADQRNGAGQAVAQPAGHSTRPSSVDGKKHGQIVVGSNGKGRGAASCVTKPKGKQ